MANMLHYFISSSYQLPAASSKAAFFVTRKIMKGSYDETKSIWPLNDRNAWRTGDYRGIVSRQDCRLFQGDANVEFQYAKRTNYPASALFGPAAL